MILSKPCARGITIKIKKFVEENFLIDDKLTGAYLPFKFNQAQTKYYEILQKTYDEGNFFSGLREQILKARQEGFTSLILALFAAIMILDKVASRFLEISYREDASKQHFRRMKVYLLSLVTHDTKKWTPELEKKNVFFDNRGKRAGFKRESIKFLRRYSD